MPFCPIWDDCVGETIAIPIRHGTIQQLARSRVIVRIKSDSLVRVTTVRVGDVWIWFASDKHVSVGGQSESEAVNLVALSDARPLRELPLVKAPERGNCHRVGASMTILLVLVDILKTSSRFARFVTANTSDGSLTEHVKRMFESRFVLTRQCVYRGLAIGLYFPNG